MVRRVGQWSADPRGQGRLLRLRPLRRAVPGAKYPPQGRYPAFFRPLHHVHALCFQLSEGRAAPRFLNAWRVNGAYPFEALVRDESIPASCVNSSTRGYFRLFLPYYLRTAAEIDELHKNELPR